MIIIIAPISVLFRSLFYNSNDALRNKFHIKLIYKSHAIAIQPVHYDFSSNNMIITLFTKQSAY